ncbi:DNA-binding domain-containing protein [Sphingomonas sp. AR_OL41]|uniref:HvfC/BufC N-terminal domain-containing protein n=1 Tax=Sphingomonas sp. AR_OL41 TaxID=3042729 RepID=UPI00248093FB|nr:DNA-binding domain-containing protein [Sphingomonas sp. AR_OL41]MDH7971316.1 DNA-binding domain-containing protein [Sphingomonas sp. AR_OL41]
MTLLELQRDMRRWLNDGSDDAAARLGAGAAPGLRVYQNNYRAQLVACLEESFAQTLAWIGGAAFHAAVVRHIERVPPSSWTLDAYSRDFPATLRMLYPDDPEVAELAWLELALGEAFVGADAVAMTAADVADVDWDTAELRFTPTLDMAAAETEAAAIWTALLQQASPPAVMMRDEPGAVIVWRRDMMAHFRAIDAREHCAILLVRAGMSFGALCAMTVDERGEADGIAQAGAWLGQWLADGLIVAVGESSVRS